MSDSSGKEKIEELLKSKLTEEQYGVMRENRTEPPFANAYWNNHEEGIYVDPITGEVLFSSVEKFDSGTGWPSFKMPVFQSTLLYVQDVSHGMVREEVRAKLSDSHLGHVFGDGPPPHGRRFCLNSAALLFISKSALASENYGHYEYLFGGLSNIIFAAGCFWGVEDSFRKLTGVLNAICGYTGGHTDNPKYEEVCTGSTGHAEAVLVSYDQSKISLESLLAHFWSIHDPTSLNRQGPDVGTQYRSAIFPVSEKQYLAAMASRDSVNMKNGFKRPVVTEIIPARRFFRAEEYHQRYLEKRRSRLGF